MFLDFFLDIKKAFDSVDHNILFDKLYHCGITMLRISYFNRT